MSVKGVAGSQGTEGYQRTVLEEGYIISPTPLLTEFHKKRDKSGVLAPILVCLGIRDRVKIGKINT